MTIAVLGLAIACGIRGMWSPCGLSMLSTITPLGERARGNSYGWSITWYVLGATAGGACLGLGLLVGSSVLSLVGRPEGVVASIAAAVVVVCLAGDARLGGLRLPDCPRQVNERWLDRYRPWAYSSGYGWQIGTGIATYLMTDAIYSLLAAAMLLLQPTTALWIGTVFGATRGACLFVGSSVTTADSLRVLHARLERLARWSIAAPAAAQAAILVGLAARTGENVVVGLSVATAIALGVAVMRRSRVDAIPSMVTS